VRSRHTEPLGFAPVGSPTWRAHAARTTISFLIGPLPPQQRAGPAETTPVRGPGLTGEVPGGVGQVPRDDGNAECVLASGRAPGGCGREFGDRGGDRSCRRWSPVRCSSG